MMAQVVVGVDERMGVGAGAAEERQRCSALRSKWRRDEEMVSRMGAIEYQVLRERSKWSRNEEMVSIIGVIVRQA